MKTLTKQKTHVATIRDVDMSIMQEVCLLLDLREEYFLDQYNQYERFVLVAVAPSHAEIIRYSKLFRSFWNNEWSIRNNHFIHYCERFKVDAGSDHANKTYFNLHDASELANDELFMAKFEEIRRIILRKAGVRW